MGVLLSKLSPGDSFLHECRKYLIANLTPYMKTKMTDNETIVLRNGFVGSFYSDTVVEKA